MNALVDELSELLIRVHLKDNFAAYIMHILYRHNEELICGNCEV